MKFPRLYDEEVSGGGGGTALTANPPAPAASSQPVNDHWTAKFEGLPDDIRSSPALKTFKSPADAVKAYVDVQPLIGMDKVVLPKDWNDKTQVAAFNKGMGVPEKPEGYTLGKVLTDKFTAGKIDVKLDENRVKAFEQVAQEAGLSPRQAALLAEKTVLQEKQTMEAANQRQDTERANALNAFKAERGSAYDGDIALAQKAIINLPGTLGKEVKDLLNATKLGDNPTLIKAFAHIGAMLKEDTAHAGGAGGVLQASDAGSAEIRIKELKANPEFMKSLQESSHPNHKAAVDEWAKVNGLRKAR